MSLCARSQQLKTKLAVAFIVLLGAFVVSPISFAQTDTGIIQGTVTDVQGAAIPNAKVTATNTSNNQVHSANTDGSGIYTIPALVRGPYHVEIQASGFSSSTEDFFLDISQRRQFNATLQPGTVTQTVEVDANSTLVDTSSSATGELITGRQIVDLPLNGRNFTQLALLTPGVTRGAYGSQASGVGNNAETFRYNQTGGAAITVNGLRQQANNFILDGLDNNEGLVNTINFFPPVEATQEFRVDTSVAPAEFGRAGGGIIETSIKSGTNSIHGSAFDFLRNSVFDANNAYFTPITNGKPTPKSPFKRNQFGGTLGGPILKNKLFLFGDFQGLRSDQPQNPQFTTVPTALMRQGNFTELLGSTLTNPPACASSSAPAGAIFNPATCQPFSYNGQLNVIAPNLINPVGQKYLKAFPAPNVSGVIQNNFASRPHVRERYNDFDVRLDYTMTKRDAVFARYSYGEDDTTQDTVLGTLPSGFGSGSRSNHPRGVAAGETHTFGSTIVNDFRYGYTRPYFDYLNPFNNVPLSQNLGIPNANRLPELGGGALIGPYGNQISYTGDGGPYIVPQKSNQFEDTLSWVHGNHSFRFGGTILKRDVGFFISDYRGKGFFQLGNGTFTGYPVSELLDGFMVEYDISNPVNVNTISYETGYYGQDDWKLNSRLTLNLGLRYDLLTNPYEQNNQWSNFNLNTGVLMEASKNGASRSLVNTYTKNFAPRFGFAYDLRGTGKTVVRGGFGIFYFLDRGGVGNQLSQNPDYTYAGAFTSSAGYRVTLSGQAPLNDNNPADASGALPAAVNTVNLSHPTNTQVISVLPNNQTSSIDQWNLQLSQQVGNATALNVAYVGNRSDHLMTWFNLNGPQLAGAAPNPYAAQGLGIIVGAATGSSNYNGLQVSLNHNMTSGLQYTMAYTWSHALDDSQSAFSNTGSNQRVFVSGTSGLLRYNYGNSDDDQRQAFTFAAMYQLPFGRGRHWGSSWNGFADEALGGWQANLIASLGTGTPFNVIGYPNNCNGCAIRPLYHGSATVGSQGRAKNGNLTWLNAPSGAFVLPGQNASGQFVSAPNMDKNQFYGPGYNPVDLSIFKNFSLTERLTMQFRAEAYNIFNTAQFVNPDNNIGDIGSGNFGTINGTRAYSEREVQFALRFTF
jgi:hypothetical protein